MSKDIGPTRRSVPALSYEGGDEGTSVDEFEALTGGAGLSLRRVLRTPMRRELDAAEVFAQFSVFDQPSGD